ncbi:hypothetical protein LTR36_001928, partial [Oleoguttula mirabilis]
MATDTGDIGLGETGEEQQDNPSQGAAEDNGTGEIEGMRFRLDTGTPFKHALDAFRSRSCKNCRKRNVLVFEHNESAVGDNDTPATLLMTGDRVIEISAHSNEPGLRCALCRPMGYPTTNGAVLDGRYPLVYDTPLRRRWFGRRSGGPSGKKEAEQERSKRTR